MHARCRSCTKSGQFVLSGKADVTVSLCPYAAGKRQCVCHVSQRVNVRVRSRMLSRVMKMFRGTDI